MLQAAAAQQPGAAALENGGSGDDPSTGVHEPSSQAGGQAVAGAGGLGAACPAVLAPRTFSRIFADFPLPFEVAQTAAFSACRNDECHSMMLFASSGDRASVSAKAPLIANDFSEQVQVNVLAATGEAHAPKASYVLLTWYLVPDASDYTRTDTYTLTVDQAGVRTELIHPPVTYTKTMFVHCIGAPAPTKCASWGEASIDLRFK